MNLKEKLNKAVKHAKVAAPSGFATNPLVDFLVEAEKSISTLTAQVNTLTTTTTPAP